MHVGDRVLEDEVDHLLVAAEQLLDLGARVGVSPCQVSRSPLRSSLRTSSKSSSWPSSRRCRPSRRPAPRGSRCVLASSRNWPKRGAVLERDPEVRVGDPEAQAALAQLELVDDALVEQAEHVGAGADDEALVGEGALQRAGAAEPLAALEDEHDCARRGRGRRPRSGRCGRRRRSTASQSRDGHLGDRHRQPDLAELAAISLPGFSLLPVRSCHCALAVSQRLQIALGDERVERVDVGLVAGVAAGDVAAVRTPSWVSSQTPQSWRLTVSQKSTASLGSKSVARRSSPARRTTRRSPRCGRRRGARGCGASRSRDAARPARSGTARSSRRS